MRPEPQRKRLSAFVVLALLASAPALAGDSRSGASEKKAAPQKQAVTILPGDIKWGDAPPDLPKGAQLAVLHGEPAKKAVFTVRLKMPKGYKIPPHWHTNDEQLTILSGTLALHMGDTMDAPAHELGAGAYHFLPGKMHHAAEAKSDLIVQLDGMGPFDIHYLNPADNPNKSASR
ncbi:MAG TPA: cupin domain-containing protein [Polyangia bacterium]|nr:cupin domain-containing protein [Polyangia bacterium]